MLKLSSVLTAGSLALTWPTAAPAGETMMIFSIDNLEWACASCRYIIEQSMGAVSGVKSVRVSLEDGTAMVVFDDEVTTAAEVAKAAGDVGYPARPFLNPG